MLDWGGTVPEPPPQFQAEAAQAKSQDPQTAAPAAAAASEATAAPAEATAGAAAAAAVLPVLPDPEIKPADITCSSGHKLKEFETQYSGFGCDVCSKGNFPSGVKMFGCRR